MLDNVKVESYGSMTTLASVAQASMKGPQLIVLTVYDPGVRTLRLLLFTVFQSFDHAYRIFPARVSQGDSVGSDEAGSCYS